jgi:3-oxoadipate enol-lactonase
VPSATVNGVDLFFERSGSGPSLLFLNGSGATLATASPFVDVFAKSFEVVAFDQRGIGRSEPSAEPYAMSDLAADALALADHVEWEHFRVAGISFGGMVAQEIAVTAPSRIVRLALLCTSPGGAGGSSFPLQTLADQEPTQRAATGTQILDTRFTPDWLESHDDDRALAALLAQRFTMDKSEDVLKGERLQLEARRGHDVYDRLPRVSCPTLVVSGRYDGIAPAVNGAAIADRIPDATLRLFEGGHMFLVQDPEAFPAIIEFLTGP